MRVLVVDDEDAVRDIVVNAMNARGYQVWSASSGSQALELAAQYDFDLVFCDVVMDGLSGFDVLKALRENKAQESEIVLMTGQASVEAAIEAVQKGANDYICKPFSISVLQAIASAVEQRRYPSKLIEVEIQKAVSHEILGNSPAMIEVVKTATRVAATELPVIIYGESGTGKELIARLIHRKSERADRPFVAVNCGALPDTLLESELFGHTRGAFTGADMVRRGLFEEADGGTLLLDEVTETSPAFQVKLLRALQEGEIRPLGSNTRKRVNVRVLAATNREPQALVESGLFRQDLLYRLQGVAITLPPLRERREDIYTMSLAFLNQYNIRGRQLSVTKDAMLALECYHWPGNVRELKHTMQRLAALSNGIIRLEDLPPEMVSTPTVASVMNDILPDGELPTLEQLEANYLLRVLSAVGGNKSRAAQILGVDRKTLYRMIDRQTAENSEKASASVSGDGRNGNH
ncbi:MAG TPA: sigma-54 dependent transcriptional regulator [Blastocatellia bacterium]|nr:sigma-54 dependent transcriptional regulator [Blastocatellia bacterium]